jgi:hypothetical protein
MILWFPLKRRLDGTWKQSDNREKNGCPWRESKSRISRLYESLHRSNYLDSPLNMQLTIFSAFYSSTQDSVVGIATGYGLDDRGVGVQVLMGSRFSFFHVVETGSGSTQPPIQWIPGSLSPGVKRSGREADHSPPASAKVKKMCIYTSTPHTSSWCSA